MTCNSAFQRILVALASTFLLCSAAASQNAPVVVGIGGSISDAPLFIAEAKGYFRDEQLDVKIETFVSAANMIAPLGAGQLDVGGGAPSAGFYNAITRNISLRIVADKASSAPGYGVNRLIVRKSLIDSGEFKTPADLKGRKVAQAGFGTSSASTMNAIVTRFGLKYTDVEVLNLAFPQFIVALQNGVIDGGMATEPTGLLAIKAGVAVPVIGDDDVLPGHQVAVLMYSERFAKSRPDVAARFMRAYIRGVRFYNDALKDHRLAGPTAQEVIDIMINATPLKDASIYKELTPVGMNPDGGVNVDSLRGDLEFFQAQKLVTEKIDLNQAIDTSFAEAAVKVLGPYKKATQ